MDCFSGAQDILGFGSRLQLRSIPSIANICPVTLRAMNRVSRLALAPCLSLLVLIENLGLEPMSAVPATKSYPPSHKKPLLAE